MKHFKSWAILFALLILGCSQDHKSATTDVMKSLGFKHKSENKDMTEETISKLKDKELEQAIVDNISSNFDPDADDVAAKIRALTPGQRAIYVTWILEAEVSNGGLKQFYTNSSRQLAGLEEEAFQTLGASEFADTMHEANDVYNANRGNLEKGVESDPFEKLDERFMYVYETTPLDKMKVDYIRAHTAEFVNK